MKGIANSNMRNTHDRFLSDDIFTLVEYHKNFKFPIEDIERIKNRINATMSPDKMGYEFFTSSPCLMIKQKKIQWLKDLL